MDAAEIVEKRPPPLCGLATLDFTCDYGRFSVVSPAIKKRKSGSESDWRRIGGVLREYSG